MKFRTWRGSTDGEGQYPLEAESEAANRSDLGLLALRGGQGLSLSVLALADVGGSERSSGSVVALGVLSRVDGVPGGLERSGNRAGVGDSGLVGGRLSGFEVREVGSVSGLEGEEGERLGCPKRRGEHRQSEVELKAGAKTGTHRGGQEGSHLEEGRWKGREGRFSTKGITLRDLGRGVFKAGSLRGGSTAHVQFSKINKSHTAR